MAVAVDWQVVNMSRSTRAWGGANSAPAGSLFPAFLGAALGVFITRPLFTQQNYRPSVDRPAWVESRARAHPCWGRLWPRTAVPCAYPWPCCGGETEAEKQRSTVGYLRPSVSSHSTATWLEQILNAPEDAGAQMCACSKQPPGLQYSRAEPGPSWAQEFG